MLSRSHSRALILLLSLVSVAALAQSNGAIEGVLTDKITGEPIEGAPVQLDGREPIKIADEKGIFKFGGLLPGQHELQVMDPEHVPITATIQVKAGQTVQVRYALDPVGSQEQEEVVIRAERLEAEVSDTVLELDEVKKIPGTQGDILKIVQSLPGVARGLAMGGSGGPGIVVRGAAPEDSKVLIDGHGVPLLYHFGGLKSVLNSDMLKRIDFLPGGFGAEFGDAIGGIVDVQTRPCSRGQYDGYVELSMLDSGFFVEGPIGDQVGFIAAARRSTIDLWLPTVLEEADIPGFELTVAPLYYDYQTKVEYSPSSRNRFYLLAFGSHDELKFLLQQPPSGDPSLRGDFEMWVDFHRVHMGWHHAPHPDWQLRVSAVAGLDRARVGIGEERYIRISVPNLGTRADFDWEISDQWKMKAGIGAGVSFFDSALRMPRPPKEGEVPGKFQTMELIESDETLTVAGGSAYVTAGYSPFPRLLMTGGLRLEYYGDPLMEVAVMPRLSIKYQARPGTVIKTGAGLYEQPAQNDELAEDFGNPDLGLERAWHFTLGLEQELIGGTDLDVTFFYKTLSQLVIRDEETNYANGGIGKIAGLEVLVRRDMSENLFGWLAYTLMSSQRRDSPDEPWRLFDFDQTHILTLVAGYRIPTGEKEPAHGLQDGWEFGLRFQLVSGNLETPIIGGVYDADYDTYLPIPGPINSERLPLYHRLDLRVDYTWAFSSWALSLFLDVQNVYNYMAIEGVRYNYDYTERAYFEGLPILPYLGLKGSF